MNKAVDPARLTKFMDSGFGEQLSIARPQSTYDPMTSWDGMAEDSQRFSRLANGTRVVPLENHPVGGLLGTVAGQRAAIPRTEAQEDAEGEADDRGGGAAGVPEDLVHHADRSEDATVLFNQRYALGVVEAPRAIAVKAPACMSKVGLLTPSERREIMEFEKYNLQSKRTRHRADLDEKRRVQIMKARHPEGCIGVDGPAAVDTNVYGEKVAMMRYKEGNMVKHGAGRAQRLAGKQSSVARVNRGLLDHDHAIKDQRETKFCQSKSGLTRQRLNTHQRIFVDDPRRDNPARTLNLRNEDLAGKNFNITTGAGHEYARSNAIPKVGNSVEHVNRQAHPSIITSKLERYGQYKSVQNKNPLY